MKKVTGIFIAVCAAFSLGASSVYDASHVRLGSAGVTVAQGDTVVLLDEDFSKPLDKWIEPHKVFEDFTWVHQAETNGVPSIRIERNHRRVPPAKRLFDTAWELMTKPLALPPSAVLVLLETRAYSNQPEFANASGCRESYHNAVYWLDEKEEVVGRSFFSFNVAQAYAAITQKEFEVPNGAVKMRMSLGADTPDLQEKEYVAFTNVKVSAIPQNGRFSPTASFTTRAVRIDGAVAMDADIPDGTAVALAVAVAPEVDSMPGTWSEFKPLDGAVFPKNVPADAKWMKLRVTLNAQEHRAPVVRSLRAGSAVFSDWHYGNDLAAPVATRVSMSPTERDDEPYVFSVVDESVINWKTLAISVNGQDALSSIRREQDTVTVAVPKGGWQQGVNVIEMSVADEHGNKSQDTMILYVGKTRTRNVVTMRDDGMTLVDGVPFFPIGMACAVKCEHNGNSYDKLFAMFEAAGMNFARHFSAFNKFHPDAPEYLAAAEKHGVKLYIAAGRQGANDTNVRRLAESVAQQLDMPNLAWDTGDDTSMHISAKQMRQRYNAIKAVDPWRITTQADPLGALVNTRYRPYALYSDNFSPEIYPVHNTSKQDVDAVVPTVVASMEAIKGDWAAVKAPVRSCWPLIQYFYNCGNWNRLQTTEELRCMSYQAIIHGAQGIIWYRYAGYRENSKTGFTAEQWSRVTTVSRELRRLYDVLCQRAADVQPEAPVILVGPKADCRENPAVSVLLKAGNGTSQVMFAASSVRETVKAQFKLPKGCGASVVDFFDGHACSPDKNGVFTDEFAPLGVHVYVVK